MSRHAKKDAEAGGAGKGVLETRKRMRRAEDGSIIVRPPKRQSQSCQKAMSSSLSVRSSPSHPEGAPVSPPGSSGDPVSTSTMSIGETELTDPDPLLAPMMPGPFEPYVEPIPGQFDAADGSWSTGFEADMFMNDTGMFCDIIIWLI